MGFLWRSEYELDMVLLQVMMSYIPKGKLMSVVVFSSETIVKPVAFLYTNNKLSEREIKKELSFTMASNK